MTTLNSVSIKHATLDGGQKTNVTQRKMGIYLLFTFFDNDTDSVIAKQK